MLLVEKKPLKRKNLGNVIRYSSRNSIRIRKKQLPKKLGVEMKAMGMVMMKQVVNEKEAYMVQQGQRKISKTKI